MAMRPTERRTAIRRQVEFILDNAEGETVHEVIIKTGKPNPDDDDFNRTVADALRKRLLATSPRDVLPAPKDLLAAGRRTAAPKAAAARRLQASDLSLSAQ